MATIFLDLDGTILDVQRRLYTVYADIVAELGGTPVSLLVYWHYKRLGMPENTIVRVSLVSDIRQYTIRRREKIEDVTYLEYDCLLPAISSSLAKLQKNNHIILTTMRSNRPNLLDQLQRLGISSLLDKVLARALSKHNTKSHMISGYVGFDPDVSVIVGDTEGDIRTGKSLGICTIAVLSGIRGQDTLTACEPDLIIKDISYLADINGVLIL